MILYSAKQIRDQIRSVLSRKNGKRLVLVAFVGQDVLDFIDEPKGLVVYCWPNVTATHPDGIRRLIEEGAKVYFVDRLHMKLFWSEGGGAVIGSSNFTQNALGGGPSGLSELAYYVSDSTQVDTMRARKTLNEATEVTPAELARFRKKWDAAAARRTLNAKGKDVKTGPVPSFSKYVGGTLSEKVAASWWNLRDQVTPNPILKAVRDSVPAAADDPDKFIADYVMCKGRPAIGTWILTCKLNESDKFGLLGWVLTHRVARMRANGDTWAAIELKGEGRDAPFDCRDKAFARAFHRYVNDSDSDFLERETISLTATRCREILALYDGKVAGG